MSRITGREAIEYAKQTGAQLYVYDDDAWPITTEQAETIVREDPSLVYTLPVA